MLLQHSPFVPKEGVELSEIASLNHQVSASFFRINYTRAIISRHPYFLLSPVLYIHIYIFSFFFIFYFHTFPERIPLPLTCPTNTTRRMHFLGEEGWQLMGGLQSCWMAFRRFTGRQLLLPRFGSFPERVRPISRGKSSLPISKLTEVRLKKPRYSAG